MKSVDKKIFTALLKGVKKMVLWFILKSLLLYINSSIHNNVNLITFKNTYKNKTTGRSLSSWYGNLKIQK